MAEIPSETAPRPVPLTAFEKRFKHPPGLVILFFAEMHGEPWKSKWLRHAAVATNEDVLFVRAAA